MGALKVVKILAIKYSWMSDKFARLNQLFTQLRIVVKFGRVNLEDVIIVRAHLKAWQSWKFRGLNMTHLCAKNENYPIRKATVLRESKLTKS